MKVFLSSRFEPLAELRSVLTKELDRAGFTVTNLDDDRASSVPPGERSRLGLEQAQAMILLLDGSYGKLVGDHSLTHQEFLWAVDAQKRILAFAKPRSEDWDEKAIKLLQDVKTRLTVGTLSPRGRDILTDVERICACALDEFTGSLGSDDDPPTPAGQVPDHLFDRINYGLAQLGLSGLADFRPEVPLTPQRLKMMEHRSIAVHALQAKQIDNAWQQIRLAAGEEVPDFATGIVMAHVAELRGDPAGFHPSYLALQSGMSVVADKTAAPFPKGDLTESTERERRVQGHILLARLQRRIGHESDPTEHARRAKYHAEAALHDFPMAQDAMVEQVLALAVLDESTLLNRLDALLDTYPDAAIRAIPLVENPGMRREMDRHVVLRITEAHNCALLKYPDASTKASDSSASHALRAYRALTAEIRSRIGGTIRDAVKLGPSELAGYKGTANRLRDTESELAEHKDRAIQLRHDWESLGREFAAPSLEPAQFSSWLAAMQQDRRQRLELILKQTRPALEGGRTWDPRTGILSLLVLGLAAWYLTSTAAHTASRLGFYLLLMLRGLAMIALAVSAGRLALKGFRERTRLRSAAASGATQFDATQLQNDLDALAYTARGFKEWQDTCLGRAKLLAEHRMLAGEIVGVRNNIRSRLSGERAPALTSPWDIARNLQERISIYEETFVERQRRWADPNIRSRPSSQNPWYTAEAHDRVAFVSTPDAVRWHAVQRYADGTYGELGYFGKADSATRALEDTMQELLAGPTGGTACARCGAPGSDACKECGYGNGYSQLDPADLQVVARRVHAQPPPAEHRRQLGASLIASAAAVVAGTAMVLLIQDSPTRAPAPGVGVVQRAQALHIAKRCATVPSRHLRYVSTASPTTSCAFAKAVSNSWASRGKSQQPMTVFSSVTKTHIVMTCKGEDPVVCRGGRAAVVVLSSAKR